MLTDKISNWLLRTVSKSGHALYANQSVALASDIGLVREENQDRVSLITVDSNSSEIPKFAAIALADGMGGMSSGAECAALAIGSFFNALIRYRKYPPEKRLNLATNAANLVVYEFCKGSGGATLSAVLFTETNQAYTVNVGDSRIYATVLNSKMELTRLTTDDSLAEAVGGHGRELLQFIGMGNGLVPHISRVPENADSLLLTSDGSHFIDFDVLKDIALKASNPKNIMQQVITYAKWRGAPDNASGACISIAKLSERVNLLEPGVEISDPHGSLQVIWTKDEQKDYPSIPKELGEPPEIFSSKESENTPSVLLRKKRSRKSNKNMNKDVYQEQFEITVDPCVEVPSEKESGNDIS